MGTKVGGFAKKRQAVKGMAKKNGHRDLATQRRLDMYARKAVRDKKGKVLKREFQSTTAETDGRIAPNPKWYGNTRVVGQQELADFREAIKKTNDNPNLFLLKAKALPMALLREEFQEKSTKILDIDPYANIIGPKAKKHRPSDFPETMKDLLDRTANRHDTYDEGEDKAIINTIKGVALNKEIEITDEHGAKSLRTPNLERAQTQRCKSELYKVIDSSDVLVQVLDARDPMGTRSKAIEGYLGRGSDKNIRRQHNMTTQFDNPNAHKHLIFLLNKVDLVPTWVTRYWLQVLSKEAPTIAFHASKINSSGTTKSFGKGALLGLLRQFARLHRDRKQISVGFIGYPNTGKSSVINTLVGKPACTVAPIPGQTKIWQYVALTRRIYLIDCPGVVYPGRETTETDLVLRGVLRPEKLDNWGVYMLGILKKTKPEYIAKTYGLYWPKNKTEPLPSWIPTETNGGDPDLLLEAVARRLGRLLKANEPDTNAAGRRIIEDWIRGKIPYFVLPPDWKDRLDAIKAGSKGASGDATKVGVVKPNTLGNKEGEVAIQPQVLENRLVKPKFRELEGYNTDKGENREDGVKYADDEEEEEEEEEVEGVEMEGDKKEEEGAKRSVLSASAVAKANVGEDALMYYSDMEDSGSDDGVDEEEEEIEEESEGDKEELDWNEVFASSANKRVKEEQSIQRKTEETQDTKDTKGRKGERKGVHGKDQGVSEEGEVSADGSGAKKIKARDVDVSDFVATKAKKAKSAVSKRFMMGSKAVGMKRYARLSRELPRDAARLMNSPFVSREELAMIMPSARIKPVTKATKVRKAAAPTHARKLTGVHIHAQHKEVQRRISEQIKKKV